MKQTLDMFSKRTLAIFLSIALMLSTSAVMAASEGISPVIAYETVSEIAGETPYVIVMSEIQPTGYPSGDYALLNGQRGTEPLVRDFSPFAETGPEVVSENFFWTFEAYESGYAIRAGSIADDSAAYLNITDAGAVLGARQALTVTMAEEKAAISRVIDGSTYYLRFSNSGGTSKIAGFTSGTKTASTQFEIFQLTEYDVTPLPDPDGEPIFTIAAISDLHADYGIQSWEQPIRTGIIKACNEIRGSEAADILMVGGDITSNTAGLGWTREQYDRAMASVYSASKSATESGRTLYVTGNHDFAAGGANWNSGDYLDDMFENIGTCDDILWQDDVIINQNKVRHALALHYVIDGLDFILMNTPYTGSDNHSSYVYTDETLTWMQSKLAEIGSDKTVVVMGHYPFRDSHGLSYPGKGMAETYDTALKNTFKMYPNLIYLYGHDHGGSYVQSDTFEKATPYSGSGKAINARVTSNDGFVSAFVGSMGYYQGSLSATQPAVVQALIVKIYRDRITFTMKNYGESTGASAKPAAYSIAKDVKLSVPPLDADQASAKIVEDMIAALPAASAITDISSAAAAKPAADAARAAYDNLTGTQQAYITASALKALADLEDAIRLRLDFIAGDVNADGTVDASDVVELRRIIAAGDPTEAQTVAGDLSGNGTLTGEDVILLLAQLDIRPGDADGDGKIAPLDIMIIRKALIDGNAAAAQLAAGDLDEDGALTPVDIMRLRKMLLGQG